VSVLAESPRRRRRGRPGAGAAFGSILVHGAVLAVAVAVAASGPDLDQFVSFNIDLVSMSGPDLGDLVVEAPASAPPESPEPTPQPVVKEPEPEPPPPKREEPAEQPDPRPTPPAPTQARPNPSSGESSGADSGEAINIRMDGLRRDYPAYYNNIILQIKRCFRFQGAGSPEAEVYFVINADGTVSDARLLRQSANPTFNYEVLGAIECAGQLGRFGSLPEDVGVDRLPIRFRFQPGNVGIFR
jgi:outer membrane biosynthesis protein TonB